MTNSCSIGKSGGYLHPELVFPDIIQAMAWLILRTEFIV
jgi:hypothetical protein